MIYVLRAPMAVAVYTAYADPGTSDDLAWWAIQEYGERKYRGLNN